MRLAVAALAVAAVRAETLEYGAEWRLMDAGRAKLSFTETGAGLGLETVGFVSRIYRVVDQYTARYASGLCLDSSLMRAEEGKKRREISIWRKRPDKARYKETDLLTGKVVRDSEVEAPGCVHDPLGALEIVRRTAPESVVLPVTSGKKTGKVRVERQGKETVRTPAGVFSTVRYEAFLFSGVVYERRARTYFWLTDDDKRIPVQIQLKLGFALGTVTLKLIKS